MAQMVQASIVFSGAIILGLSLTRKVEFGVPVLSGEKSVSYIKSILKLSIGMGILGGILVILLSMSFGSMSISFLKAEMEVATWKGFLASFYRGIAEEIVFRLFLNDLVCLDFS